MNDRATWPCPMFVLALALSLLDLSGQGFLSAPSRPTVSGYSAAGASGPDQATTALLSSVAVAIECTADATGRVGTCVVLEETHPGLGFGTAALALMQGTEIEPAGVPVRFVRTIQFTP